MFLVELTPSEAGDTRSRVERAYRREHVAGVAYERDGFGGDPGLFEAGRRELHLLGIETNRRPSALAQVVGEALPQCEQRVVVQGCPVGALSQLACLDQECEIAMLERMHA